MDLLYLYHTILWLAAVRKEIAWMTQFTSKIFGTQCLKMMSVFTSALTTIPTKDYIPTSEMEHLRLDKTTIVLMGIIW